jgi:hypothetical protein
VQRKGLVHSAILQVEVLLWPDMQFRLRLFLTVAGIVAVALVGAYVVLRANNAAIWLPRWCDELVAMAGTEMKFTIITRQGQSRDRQTVQLSPWLALQKRTCQQVLSR